MGDYLERGYLGHLAADPADLNHQMGHRDMARTRVVQHQSNQEAWWLSGKLDAGPEAPPMLRRLLMWRRPTPTQRSRQRSCRQLLEFAAPSAGSMSSLAPDQLSTASRSARMLLDRW